MLKSAISLAAVALGLIAAGVASGQSQNPTFGNITVSTVNGVAPNSDFQAGVIYVSKASANGIGVGTDTQGCGTSIAPCLTPAKALSIATRGKTIKLNNGTYTVTGTFVLPGVNLDCVAASACTLRTTATDKVLSIVSAYPVSIGSVTVDGQGTTATGVSLDDVGAAASLSATNFTGVATCLTAASGSQAVKFAALTANLTAGTSCVSFLALGAGGSIVGTFGAVTMTTAQSGFGMVADVRAVGPGTTVDLSGATATLAATAGVNTHSAINVVGANTVRVRGNVITITDNAANLACDGIDVSHPVGTTLLTLQARVERNTINHDCGGGRAITIGQDGDPGVNDRNFVNDAIVTDNRIFGTTYSSNGGLHGILFGWQQGGKAERNFAKLTGYTYLCKGTTRGPIYTGNVVVNSLFKMLYQKGGNGCEFWATTAYNEDGFRPYGWYYGQDTSSNTGPAYQGVLCNNVFYYKNPGPNPQYIFVDTVSTPKRICSNNYYATGTGFNQYWNYRGTAYTSLANWTAVGVETDGSALDPVFVDATNSNFDVGYRTPLGTGQANSAASGDFLARSYGQSPRRGAYEQYIPPAATAAYYLDLTTTPFPGGDISVIQAGSTSYVTSAGLVATAAANTARYDYDPATHAGRGLLIEGASTNLFLQSTLASGWTAVTSTLTAAAATGADGVASSAANVVSNTATAAHGTSQAVSVTSLQAYTVSIWMKPIGSYSWGQIRLPSAQFGVTTVGNFNLTGSCALGTVTAGATATCQAFPSGWYRVSLTAAATVSGSATILFYTEASNNLPSFTGDGSSGFSLWGAQIEAKAFPTSYIPTTSGTVTRAADVVALAGTAATAAAAGPTVHEVLGEQSLSLSRASFGNGAYVLPSDGWLGQIAIYANGTDVSGKLNLALPLP